MRDGTVVLAFSDDRAVTADLGHPVFEPTSMLDSSTFLPQAFRLVLRTTRGDEIVLELPGPTDLAPLRGRPTIYLDQNHWSTLAKTIHVPHVFGTRTSVAPLGDSSTWHGHTRWYCPSRLRTWPRRASRTT